jgi:hypothetical protein
MLWNELDPPKQLADKYHHVVVFPLMCYMVAVSIPVVVLAGTRLQEIGMWFMLVTYLFLLATDIRTRRMNQRPWMREHCQVEFKNEG